MKKHPILINLFGILLALGIGLGGLWAVRQKLREEQSEILRSGGMIRVLTAAECTAGVSGVTMPANLTEEELLRAVRAGESDRDPFLHEPAPGQLTMAQALEYGKTWMEDFLLPSLGLPSFLLEEYKAGCYLWSGYSDAPVSDYWTVEITALEIEASLIINAVSGQVLDASVTCSFPVKDQNRDNLYSLLWNYGDSFGLPGDYSLVIGDGDSAEDDGRILYCSIGTRGLYAALETEYLVISRADTPSSRENTFDTELFTIRLRLLRNPSFSVSPPR